MEEQSTRSPGKPQEHKTFWWFIDRAIDDPKRFKRLLVILFVVVVAITVAKALPYIGISLGLGEFLKVFRKAPV